jgi:glutathione-specific gamma-glutamylcyclotransferase
MISLFENNGCKTIQARQQGESTAMRLNPKEDVWVFGYGSLMWRPGFAYEERHHARLNGFHRALCVYSYVHRGTPEQPGLVLGLDRGGACRGVAYRVASAQAGETIAYLRAREQATDVYLERYIHVTLDDGRRVRALVYLVDRDHCQYAGRLPRNELLRLVRQGIGQSGPNPEYVRNTHAELASIGVNDRILAWLDWNLA